MTTESLIYLISLPGPKQTMVHEDACELITDGTMDESSGDRRINPTGEAAYNLPVTHLSPDPINRLFDDRKARKGTA
jgi:hypothetical protein